MAAVWAGVSWREYRKAAGHVVSDEAFQLETFTIAQAADVEAFASQIIPSEPDSPGAREAHVVRFIDHVLAKVIPGYRAEFLAGLAEFQTVVAKAHGAHSPFAGLNDADQKALITTIQHEKLPFFRMMRIATSYGMFANPEYGGNSNKAGWKLIGFEDRFSWSAPFGYYDRPENANA